MTELEQTLTGDSYAAAPAHILEGLSEDLARHEIAKVPHSIYAELWHAAFWQQVTLDWVRGIETPFPAKPTDGFPTEENPETWEQLRVRFLNGAQQAAEIASDATGLDQPIRCPSRPGHESRVMSIRDQLISLTAHNAYHFGRIVVLRHLLGVWPPASGGFTW